MTNEFDYWYVMLVLSAAWWRGKEGDASAWGQFKQTHDTLKGRGEGA